MSWQRAELWRKSSGNRMQREEGAKHHFLAITSNSGTLHLSMAAYMKKAGGKRFGTGKSSFGARGAKPAGARSSFGAGRTDDRPKTFYKATCNNCGNSCDVPFKPVNGKPVFCRDCFVKTGDTAGGRASDRAPRRDFSPRATAPQRESDSSAAVLKKLDTLIAKIDELIVAVGASK